MSNVEHITNLIYSDETGNRIDCLVKFDTINFPVPFTADKNDSEEHGRAIYAAIKAGQYGEIAAYVIPPAPPSPEQQDGPKVIA